MHTLVSYTCVSVCVTSHFIVLSVRYMWFVVCADPSPSGLSCFVFKTSEVMQIFYSVLSPFPYSSSLQNALFFVLSLLCMSVHILLPALFSSPSLSLSHCLSDHSRICSFSWKPLPSRLYLSPSPLPSLPPLHAPLQFVTCSNTALPDALMVGRKRWHLFVLSQPG